MPDKEADKTIKDIYNEAVKLLELLNVLIPQIDTYKPKVSADLIKQVWDVCYELGGSLCVHSDELEGKKEEDEWDNYTGC